MLPGSRRRLKSNPKIYIFAAAATDCYIFLHLPAGETGRRRMFRLPRLLRAAAGAEEVFLADRLAALMAAPQEGCHDGSAACRSPPHSLPGITGRSRWAGRDGPKCNVTLPPKISGGRSVGSSCTNGPQPRMGFFMFESVAASPSYS